MTGDELVAKLGREIAQSIDGTWLSPANNVAAAIDELIQTRIAEYVELMADRLGEKVKAAQ